MKLEVERKAVNGLLVLFAVLVAAAADIYAFVNAAQSDNAAQAIGAAVAIVLLILILAGLFTVQPNQARVLTLFGKYDGLGQDAGTDGGPTRSSSRSRSRCGCGTSRPPSSR